MWQECILLAYLQYAIEETRIPHIVEPPETTDDLVVFRSLQRSARELSLVLPQQREMVPIAWVSMSSTFIAVREGQRDRHLRMLLYLLYLLGCRQPLIPLWDAQPRYPTATTSLDTAITPRPLQSGLVITQMFASRTVACPAVGLCLQEKAYGVGVLANREVLCTGLQSSRDLDYTHPTLLHLLLGM